jgi:serine/threonine protein kinase
MTTMNEQFPCDFGRYRLVGRIATGGMAELFRATIIGMEGFEKTLAIKRILPHLTDQEELLLAFIGEAKLAALLSHPNIVQIYDFGCIEGGYFIAMEHLSGRDLSIILLRGREKGLPVTLEHALYMASRICEGLDYAHTRKDAHGNLLSIIHRDISPPNVLITYEGEVRIVDFGVAKAAGMNTKTREGVIKGKVCYMSPEQASGREIDHRSDIFSAGVLLYEMVTGRRMFTGDPLHTLLRVREVDFQPAENVAPGLPQEVYRILRRALAKDPDLRYQSAARMLSDIEEFLHVTSMRPSARTLSKYMKELFADEIAFEDQVLRETPQGLPSGTVTPVAEERKAPVRTTLMTSQKTQRIRQAPLFRPMLGLLLSLLIVLAGFFALSFTEESLSTLYRPASASGSLSPAGSVAGIPSLQFESPSLIPVGSSGHEKAASKSKTPQLEKALKALKARQFAAAAALFRDTWLLKPELAEEIRSPYAESLEQWGLSIKGTEPKKATELLEQALAIDSSRVRTRFELASLYTAAGRHEKAIQTYEQIAEKGGAMPEAVFNLAYLHAVAKNYAKAEAMYRRLVDLAPRYLDEVLFNLALVQEKQGKKAHCVRNLQKAVAFNPSNESAKNYLRKVQGRHS